MKDHVLNDSREEFEKSNMKENNFCQIKKSPNFTRPIVLPVIPNWAYFVCFECKKARHKVDATSLLKELF